MKCIATLALLLSFNAMGTTSAVHPPLAGKSSSYTRATLPANAYCTEERFRGYINLAASMRDYVSPYDYADLYLPLKVKASRALVTLKTYGPISRTTHEALYEIVKFVRDNENSFNSLWEVEAFFPVAQDLMEMTLTLSRDLQ